MHVKVKKCVIHDERCGMINGKGDLSIIFNCISIFYRNRDKAIHASQGMGETEKPTFGRVGFLRLLFWSLGSVCASRNLQA